MKRSYKFIVAACLVSIATVSLVISHLRSESDLTIQALKAGLDTEQLQEQIALADGGSREAAKRVFFHYMATRDFSSSTHWQLRFADLGDETDKVFVMEGLPESTRCDFFRQTEAGRMLAKWMAAPGSSAVVNRAANLRKECEARGILSR